MPPALPSCCCCGCVLSRRLVQIYFLHASTSYCPPPPPAASSSVPYSLCDASAHPCSPPLSRTHRGLSQEHKRRGASCLLHSSLPFSSQFSPISQGRHRRKMPKTFQKSASSKHCLHTAFFGGRGIPSEKEIKSWNKRWLGVNGLIVKVYFFHGLKILKIVVEKPKISFPLFYIGDFGWEEDTSAPPSLVHGYLYSALTIFIRKDILSSDGSPHPCKNYVV